MISFPPHVDHRDGLPDEAALAALLARGGAPGGAAAELLAGALVGPARALVQRPSKGFRARLVEIGCALVQRSSPACGSDAAHDGATELGRTAHDAARERRLALAMRAVELLHVGSLIVDDIQDGSPVRRGAPSLHLEYGLPSALCAGNWLYFWPLRLIGAMELPPAREQAAYRLYHDALERAHYGQALDLGVDIAALAQDRVSDVCAATTALKTGALTALAMQLGALAGGAGDDAIERLGIFGRRFGIALQQLDDLGNALGGSEPSKQFEDLVQKKPSALWSLAAARCDIDAYAEFKRRVAGLPAEGTSFLAWIDGEGLVAAARDEAERGLRAALDYLAESWPLAPNDPPLQDLERLAEKLLHAYR